MGPRILYLGIDPSRYRHSGSLTHYPVIRTEPVAALDPLIAESWESFSHVLFTSPSAVKHWNFLPLQEKKILSIGPATSSILSQKGLFSQQALFATQEGVIALLQTLSVGKLFWPRSHLSRPTLERFLQRRKIPYALFSLYKTIFQQPGPLPDLALFDEIVFTSPSTVDAFLQIYSHLPNHLTLKAIGPVTRSRLLFFTKN